MPVTFDDLIPPQAGGVSFDDLIPRDSIAGSAKAVFASGLPKGVADLIGFPGLLEDAGNEVYRQTAGRAINAVRKGSVAALGDTPPEAPASRAFPNSEMVQKKIEGVTGPLYQPQTPREKYLSEGARFVPGAAAIPARGAAIAGNVMRYGVLPGVASEAAGQYAEGTALEPAARIVAGLATAGAGALTRRPGAAEQAIASYVPGLNESTLNAAKQLIDDAAQRGMSLSWAEAIDHVSGRSTGLSDLARVVEGANPQATRPFFSQRPGQVDAAARAEFDAMSPPPRPPGQLGAAAQEEAQGVANDVRGAINKAADPFYRAASADVVDRATMDRIRATPGWAEASNAVRSDPQLARYVAGLPDESVGFLNEVKKYLDQAGENAAGAFNAQRNQQRAAGYGADAKMIRDEAVRASPGNYGAALGVESVAREKYLQPILQGPLGKIANTPEAKSAIGALFPDSPLPGQAAETGAAVRALVRRNPKVAGELVRAKIESVFDEATQRLASGQNEFGGSKFAAVLRGNQEQAETLRAAVQALPGGGLVWQGFGRFLEIMEAQGTRQQIGSRTSFNTQAMQDMRNGSITGQAASVAVAPGKLATVARDMWERWRLGQNLDGIARLMTDPRALSDWQRIARSAGTGDKALVAAIRIGTMAEAGRQRGPRE